MVKGSRYIILTAIWLASVICSGAYGQAPKATELRKADTLMSQDTTLRDLFDRWERVWHEGQYDLIAGCIAPNYIRHDEAGDRTVTREAYAAEIAKTRQDRPQLRFVVFDHSFEGNRAWFRFTLKWKDATTGEARSRAGVQVYRVEDGKLAETWLMFQPLGSAWSDAVGQEHWTSPPPIK